MAVMTRMRENMKTILMILVFAFILTIIIDWGMGGRLSQQQQQGVIAVVNDHEIMYEEFSRRYQDELRAHRERTGNEPEGFQLQQLENQVFESLIQQRLLTDVVQKAHLQATDQEIVEDIYNNPPDILRTNEAFLDSNGVFDMARYQEALNNPAANWGPVEDYLRVTLPMRKLEQLLRTMAIATDDDARLEYMRTNNKAKIHYLFYNATNYADRVPEPSEDEIKNYYKAHQKDFHENEKRSIEYVLIELKPTKTDTQAVFTQAQEILDDAKSGQDFAKLAELYSQDPGSAPKGGDLGFFTRETMVKPFSDAAFAAQKGDIVGPVQSNFGLHIIKVEDKKKEDGVEKVSARHILLKIEASAATRESLRDEANYIAEYAKESDLEKVAQAEGFQIQASALFERDAFIPGIGMESRINRLIFRQKEGYISDAIQLERGFLVFSIKSIQPERIKPMDDAKPQIINLIKNQKRLEIAKVESQKAYDNLKSGMTLDAVALIDSQTIQETDFFDMSGYIAKIGREPNVASAAFSLNEGDFSQPIEGTRGYYLIQVIEKTPFNEQEFESQKERLKQQLVAQQQQQMFALWYAALKKDAKIKDFRDNYL